MQSGTQPHAKAHFLIQFRLYPRQGFETNATRTGGIFTLCAIIAAGREAQQQSLL